MSEAFEKEAVGAAVRPAAAVRQVGVSRRRLESLRLLPQQRQPLAEILSQSGAIDEAELGRLRRELSDLWCQVHGVTSGSLEEQDVRFQLLRVLKEGESVEDVTRLFVRSLSESAGKKRDGAESRPREELPRVNELAERAESLIRSRCHERLSLGDLAQALAVSREHLSRVFKRCHGCTVTDYIHRVRIERARQKIAEGGFSLKQVCFEVGYQSYNDFYRNFRKQTGRTPRDFLPRALGD